MMPLKMAIILNGSLLVQIMSDDEHPELDFDPLDDTKLWPEDQFPWLTCRKNDVKQKP